MQMSELGSIPTNVGTLPPLSDTNFEYAITNSTCALMAESGVDPNSNGEASSSSSNSGTIVPSLSSPCLLSPFNFHFCLLYFPTAQQPSEEDEGKINPLPGTELTDEQHNLILQDIVSGDGFLDGLDNFMSSSPSSAASSGSGLGSSSAYVSEDGNGFLGSETSAPTPIMGVYEGGEVVMGWWEEGVGGRERRSAWWGNEER